MLSLLDADSVAGLLEHMDEDLRKEVTEKMPRGTLAQILDRTENDIAVDILREMAPSDAVRTMAQMKTAADILPLLQHEDESAGGIMTRGYVALHKDMTVADAVQFLRATKPLAEEAYYLYVLDAEQRLLGVVSFRELFAAPSDKRVRDIMHTDAVTAPEEMDQEALSRLFKEHGFLAIPVVELLAGALLLLGWRVREALIALGFVLLIVTFGHLLKEPLYEFHTHVIPRLALLLFLLMLPREDDRFSIVGLLTRRRLS